MRCILVVIYLGVHLIAAMTPPPRPFFVGEHPNHLDAYVFSRERGANEMHPGDFHFAGSGSVRPRPARDEPRGPGHARSGNSPVTAHAPVGRVER